MTNRPLITFVLCAYNQEQFIREAVKGAFAQTYSPLEIILSDDGSSDRTFEIMSRMATEYNGPHTVVLNQNQPNLGLVPHANKVIMEISQGDILVMAAGDDISFPDRVEKSWRILEDNPDANCVSFQYQIINRDGIPNSIRTPRKGQLEKYSLSDYISQKGVISNGATRAFRKSVFDYFGPLSDNAATEDSTTLLRCLMLGTACHSYDVEIHYRVHGNNYYSSENKHLINYKGIYWQYMKDVAIALRNGVITTVTAQRLKDVLRRRLKRNLLTSGYYLSGSKIHYFFSKLLFSDLYTLKDKIFLLLHLLRSSV